jgi:hypothetical protein
MVSESSMTAWVTGHDPAGCGDAMRHGYPFPKPAYSVNTGCRGNGTS